jgi:CBS domain-containing protein
MPLDETVQTVMTRSLITVTSKTPVREARARLATGNIHHLPVVDGDRLVGIVSATDFVRQLACEARSGHRGGGISEELWTVAEIMQPNPRTVGPETTLREAIDILTESSFHSLPVVKNGTLMGILTTTDLLRRLREALGDPTERKHLQP